MRRRNPSPRDNERRVARAQPCPAGQQLGRRASRLRRRAVVGPGPFRLAARQADPGRVQSDVLDLCAAPGGKTMQLAAAGHRVTSVDASASRLGRLRENLQRTHLEAQLVEADALDWSPERAFDAILLDAPCSATGTFRRHPEVLYRARPEDHRRGRGASAQASRPRGRVGEARRNARLLGLLAGAGGGRAGRPGVRRSPAGFPDRSARPALPIRPPSHPKDGCASFPACLRRRAVSTASSWRALSAPR